MVLFEIHQRFKGLFLNELGVSFNENLLSTGSDLPESDIDFEVQIDLKLESAANSLRTDRHAANESLVVENENLLELAPGQVKETKHISFDEKCEELAFPKVFKGKFEYTFPREHYLTSTKYFNQRLLNCLLKHSLQIVNTYFCTVYITAK